MASRAGTPLEGWLHGAAMSRLPNLEVQHQTGGRAFMRSGQGVRASARVGALVLLTWALAGLACPGQAQAAAAACHAWGDVVKLSGQLSMRTFAGPPNYESVKRGDAREVLPVLRLQHKLCVQGGGDHHQVAQVQLLDLHDALRGGLLARCLKHCRLSGELQVAESGHHHLPVLLELADDPEALDGQDTTAAPLARQPRRRH